MGDAEVFSAGQTNVPAGGVSATTFQDAINELDAEKQPRAHPLKATAAAFENSPRATTTLTNSGTILSAGRLTMAAIYLPSGVSVASITFCSGSQAEVTPAHGWASLHDQDRALLRQSTDDVATGWAANTPRTFALSSAFVTTYAGLHYLGVMIDAATVPSILGVSGVVNVMGAVPILAGTSNTGLTTTAPNPANALTAIGIVPWAYVSS